VFASTWQIDWYDSVISDLFDGARSAIKILEDNPSDGRAAALDTLRRTLDSTGFEPSPRSRGPRNETG
jgi:hypothetical protein